jgi:hypothetical protein
MWVIDEFDTNLQRECRPLNENGNLCFTQVPEAGALRSQ